MTIEKELLDFNFDKSFFEGHAGVSGAFKNQLELRIKKLVRWNLNELFTEQDEDSVKEVYLKFKNYLTNNDISQDTFIKKDLRLLSHSITYSINDSNEIIENKDELKELFYLLETNWSDSFLVGLVNGMLSHWRFAPKSSVEILSNFIINKLNNYKGDRKSILSLKPLIRYFNPNNGDILLGVDLVENEISILNCTQSFNIPDNWFSYSFFSNVILSYYSKRKNDLEFILDDLEVSLERHQSIRLNKIIIAKLINQATLPEFFECQEKIKRIAFNFIGDPEISSKWKPASNAPSDHFIEIKKAQETLNQWVIQQFINVFFEKCINDPRRKKYWLKYSKHISQFNVIGSKFTRRILLSDERIKEFIPTRFKMTRNGEDSAIMFALKSHILVEFSDTGKLYAYNRHNKDAPSFETKSYININDLKLNFAYQKQLIYRTGRRIDSYSDEGSQPHHDGEMTWEEVFTKWINLKIGL